MSNEELKKAILSAAKIAEPENPAAAATLVVLCTAIELGAEGVFHSFALRFSDRVAVAMDELDAEDVSSN
jgi:hypothetical protein